MSNQKSIVFVGVEVDLFKMCFVETSLNVSQPRQENEEQWEEFELIVIDETSATANADLSKSLQNPAVRSVVFQDIEELDASLLHTLRQFYDSGGLVVYFGIDGVFTDSSALSKQFDLPEAWSYSGYTKYEYETTTIATDSIGFNVMESQYSKSNMLLVPMQDRWMVPKAVPLHRYLLENAGCLDDDASDDEWTRDAERVKAGYIKYCEELYEYCPLAVHKNKNCGRLAYLGFVNGDGNVPYIVRALVTNKGRRD